MGEFGPGNRHPAMIGLDTGQVFEFRLWAEVTEQSRGRLHVFLPTVDLGIDGVLHRLTDGAYIPIQAKVRTLQDNRLDLIVPEHTLVDDEALIVAGQLVEGGFGPRLLVIREGDFRRLASRTLFRGLWILAADVTLHDSPRASKWRPYVVRREDLADRLLGEPRPAIARPAARAGRDGHWMGGLGEAEVVRRLAEVEALNLFRPFPDMETVEVLVRHRESRTFTGLQVKVGSLGAGELLVEVSAALDAFRPFPSTHFACLAWLAEGSRFHDECLLIPSMEMTRVGTVAGGRITVRWCPGRGRGRSRVDPYRLPLADLGRAVAGLG